MDAMVRFLHTFGHGVRTAETPEEAHRENIQKLHTDSIKPGTMEL